MRLVGGRAFFSGDTEQSGVGAATAFLSLDPSPSPATAPASMSAPDVVGPGESGPYVPAFRGVLLGGMSSFGAESVADDQREKWCEASLSVPGAADLTATDAVAVLHLGSGITAMSVGIAHKLQAVFPDVQLVGGITLPGKLKVADGRVLAVQEKTWLVRIALHTSWGLVTMGPFSFAVMPGDDDVVILGNPTLKLLGIIYYDSFVARARERAPPKGVDTAAYRQCRRVTVSIDALQQQTSLTPEASDEAVELLVARGPDIDMSPEEELRARSEALEGAAQASAAAGLDDSLVERLRGVVGRRWNAVRRGLRRGDPPVRV